MWLSCTQRPSGDFVVSWVLHNCIITTRQHILSHRVIHQAQCKSQDKSVITNNVLSNKCIRDDINVRRLIIYISPSLTIRHAPLAIPSRLAYINHIGFRVDYGLFWHVSFFIAVNSNSPSHSNHKPATGSTNNKKPDIAGARSWNQKSRKAYGICMSLYDQHPVNGKISGAPFNLRSLYHVIVVANHLSAASTRPRR